MTHPGGHGPYHTRFGRFDRRTLATTDRYFSANPWRGNTLAKAQTWVDEVAAIYDIPAPMVAIVGLAQCCGSGCYIGSTNQILLPKASATTLFHEFRHALQHHGAIEMIRPRYGDVRHEEDARAWSLSLFYQVRPDRFCHQVRVGTILYVPADTLPPLA